MSLVPSDRSLVLLNKGHRCQKEGIGASPQKVIRSNMVAPRKTVFPTVTLRHSPELRPLEVASRRATLRHSPAVSSPKMLLLTQPPCSTVLQRSTSHSHPAARLYGTPQEMLHSRPAAWRCGTALRKCISLDFGPRPWQRP